MASDDRSIGSSNTELGQDSQFDPILYSSNTDRSSTSSSITQPPVGGRDPSSLRNGPAPDQLEDKIDTDIRKIARDLDIRKGMAEHLRRLHDFEFVIVCDDSGSMGTLVDGTQRTRWDELCYIVKLVISIGVIFDSNGVDIHFLNRKSFENVKDPATVSKAFEKPPSGYTPLVPVLTKIFTSNLAQRGRDKRLLVFVATDGIPTDNNGNEDLDAFKNVMERTRQKDKTYVSFLLCTDEPNCMEYMREWDKRMKNVDVTDDFNTERARIRECQKNDAYPFSRGDYIVKALVGAIVPEIDNLNEPS